MAGLHVYFGARDETRIEAVARCLRVDDESQEHISDGPFQCLWLGHEAAERHAPAHDPVSGVRLITSGRAVLRQDAESVRVPASFTGGRVNRVLLARYLDDGVHDLDGIDGAMLLCVWDPRSQALHVWTDAFGYHPAFLYEPQDPSKCVLTTFPDAIAHDPATRTTWDLTSMVEFLRGWRITPPHTYYNEVRYAGAATRWSWDLASGKATSQVWWRPFQEPFHGSLAEAADDLSQAVAASIRDRTGPGSGPIAAFVSGGADSRVLLFGARDPAQVTGINLYDEPTPESRITKRLCERAGATYLGFARDRDYYPRLMPEIVRWSGAMWCAEDSHYLGVRDVVRETGARTVMTACTTDWLFKGYGLEKTKRRLFGRELPLERLTSERVDGFLPNAPAQAPADFRDAVDARMDAWFDGTAKVLRTDRERLEVEDRRIRPACYAVSVSGSIMYRTFPYDTFLADGRVAAAYSRIRPGWKLDGRVWGLAAAAICRRANTVVDANNGWSLGASAPARVAAFARGWIQRRLRRLRPAPKPDGPATGSWPDYGWYIRNSASIQRLWEETPGVHRARLAQVLGRDPWDRPLTEWSGEAALFFRMATLLQHWRTVDRLVEP